MFHPFRAWLWRGPFTSLFITFLRSNIKGSSKFTIMAYIGTYCTTDLFVLLIQDAMAAAWISFFANYFITGWFIQSVDQYYLNSFSIMLSVIFVFGIGGPFFNAILRYRCKMGSFLHLLVENYLWTPMFVIFFGGISLHLSWTLISYFLSIDMQWGSTAKVSSSLPGRLTELSGIRGIEFLEGVAEDHSRL